MIYKCCNVFVDGYCARLGQLLSCGSISQENTLLSVPSAAGKSLRSHLLWNVHSSLTRNRPDPSPRLKLTTPRSDTETQGLPTDVEHLVCHLHLNPYKYHWITQGELCLQGVTTLTLTLLPYHYLKKRKKMKKKRENRKRTRKNKMRAFIFV